MHDESFVLRSARFSKSDSIFQSVRIMLKSTNSIYQLDYPAKNVMTPIRDYTNDYFHENDSKLGVNVYRNGTNGKYSRNPYNRPLRGTADSDCDTDRVMQECNASKRGRDEEDKEIIQKKPPSLNLVWDAFNEPSQKKTYSPLDLHKFKDYMTLESPRIDPKLSNLLQTIQNLVETEEKYARVLEISNAVYRRELHENRKFKNKLLNKNSNEELLLFGNIDTIFSLSIIFVRSIMDSLSKCSGVKFSSDTFWTDLKMNPQLASEALNSLKISDILESHFHKIKSTYSSYAISHQKQVDFLEDLKKKKTTIFYKWYGECLKKSNYIKLEDILKRPVERLEEWANIVEDILLYGDNFLSKDSQTKLSNFNTLYLVFMRDLKRDVSEYGQNASYEFSLTPTEIINLYGNFTSQGKKSLPDFSEKRSNQQTSASIVSTSSSKYTDSSLSSFGVRVASTECTERADPNENTLNDWVKKFKRIRKSLIKLEDEINKNDLVAILDKNLRQAETWQKFMEFESPNEFIVNHDNVASIYSAYIEKIHQQRQRAMMLKLSDLQKRVIVPLKSMIETSSSVKSKIQDLQTLKREYMVFLRDKSHHDIKKEAMAKHFEGLQNQLLQELPQYIQLIHYSVETLLLVYNKVMMQYMEILSGGEKFLRKELDLLESGDRELGDNFDILQMFSSSRFYTKQAVRENWKNGDNPSCSRVVRKMFEL